MSLLCLVGLHCERRVAWVEHPEGVLGYWYCPKCSTTFHGYIHEPNPDGRVSAHRVRDVSKQEVKKFLSNLYARRV